MKNPFVPKSECSFVELILTVLFCFTLFGLSYGLVVRDYWHWFIAPLGLPVLPLTHSSGLAILARLLGSSSSLKPTGQTIPTAFDLCATIVTTALMFWIIGFILHTIS
jgi:hypothetical protein